MEITEATPWNAIPFATLKVALDDNVLSIQLHRPERKNAINPTMANELVYCLRRAKSEAEIRSILLTASGTIFCAGGDLATMASSSQENESPIPKQGELHDISLALVQAYKPVVVALEGPVLAGGLMLTANATHVVAGEDTYFAAPEIKRGLWPFMVMAALLRVMPRRTAIDFMARGYKMPAAQALAAGLATEVAPQDQVLTRATELARELASFSPSTMSLGLEALWKQETMAFEEAIPYLMEMLAQTIATEDAQEGIRAFFEKRDPVWKGR